MKSKMFRSGHKLKIVNIIIKFISVDMMHNFVGLQLSSKAFFHNKPMDSVSRTIRTLEFVTRKHTVAFWGLINRITISQKATIMTNTQSMCSAFISIAYFLTVFDFTLFFFHKI
ncbi:hypothetical protein LCGC14_2837570 [marine sediment metagenome]|uniref:Uncharacterized protein n=1 Tax=marine sediment metagenome TaxID=412755 RepID=A0A0F8YYU5_9ZZZZ